MEAWRKQLGEWVKSVWWFGGAIKGNELVEFINGINFINVIKM